MTVPALGKPRVPRIPTVSDTVLDNGLRVLAVRRTGVPLVELRLSIPFGAPDASDQHVARTQLLGDTMLSGTAGRSAAQIAAEVQALGGQLSVGADADRLAVSGSVLVSGLPGMLELVADLLTAASYPKKEVVGERDRLVQSLTIHRSSAGVVAREALMRRMYGDHPYGLDLPSGEAVEGVKPRDLRALHRARVLPTGSTLVVVGDLTPARANAAVATALAGWTGDSKNVPVPAGPVQPGRTALLLDRPGAVQTTIRFGGAALSRTQDGFAALAMANMVFGGYFSSRWVSNIREDKGYTYSPHSVIDHPVAGSRWFADADVATEVTAPAMVETLYELGRIASVPVSQDELDQARRYAIGTLALGSSTQAGIAGVLSQLTLAGLGLSWLRDYPALLSAVTVDDVHEAAATWLAPQALTPVLVGDVSVVKDSLSGILELETA